MDKDCTCFVTLPCHADSRGNLVVAESGGGLPFEPKRVFWISGVPAGARRGGHAHWSCKELLFAVTGSVEVELDYGDHTELVLLDRADVGVVVDSGVWCVLRHFSEGAVCVVLCSEAYNADGYVHDREEWSRILDNKKIKK